MTTLRQFLQGATQAIVGQRPEPIQAIIDEETQHFRGTVSVTERRTIPDTTEIPIENPTHWLKIPDVIACFVDMAGSTKLSAGTHPNTTAKCYRYFTNTAIRIFHEMESPYIDVKGDGVFGLFDSSKAHTALAAVVSFKTFVHHEFTPRVKEATGGEIIGGHYGIDCRTVLVRKLGLKAVQGRTDRQNEVWAGKPVNMAAKLASRSVENKVWVSDRFYGKLTGDRALNSCGCGNDTRQKTPLWTRVDVSDDDRFDFDTAYVLTSNWCTKHGREYFRNVVHYDG
jgi:class 3 adenylate cyclase